MALGEKKALQESQNKTEGPEIEIDIDLDDPEVAMAATKIQAGYKGLVAREEFKDLRKPK